MGNFLKKIYDLSPPLLREATASARGFYLRWWRYGPETERLVEEALGRESWSAERWKAFQEEDLAELLHIAATRVPYYRNLWQERRRHGDTTSWEILENWPILTKAVLRTQPKAFVDETKNRKLLFRLSTSGTSGKPLTLWRDKRASRAWYALFEARWRRWNNVTMNDRWGILGGQLVVPVAQKHPPYWVWNSGLNQLYMSTFHLSKETTQAYLEAIRGYGITYLYGYASSLYTLANNILSEGLHAPSLKVAISNAEPLLPHHKEAINLAFGCPARDTYGMAEIVAGASECQHNSLHLWPEAGIIEVMHNDRNELVSNGEVGRLICTGLLNKAMPLIRYEVGDRASIANTNSMCACGRSLPMLEKIEGRTIDNLVTRDGRKIFWLNPVFYGLNLHESQIIQEDYEDITVKIVPSPSYKSDEAHVIAYRIKERLGKVKVKIEVVHEIPRGANGKFRAVVNKIDKSH